MRKYLKEFCTFSDVTVMLFILLVCASLTAPHVLHLWTWVALAVGMLTYATSEYMVHRFIFHIKTEKTVYVEDNQTVTL